MFFEEESKDTHKNMDDYDLNFEKSESADWDKLLSTKDSEDDSDISISDIVNIDDDENDSLFDLDDESFDALIQDKKEDIIKNREEIEEEDDDSVSFSEIANTPEDEQQTVNVDALSSSDEIELDIPDVVSGQSEEQDSIMQEPSVQQVFDNTSSSNFAYQDIQNNDTDESLNDVLEDAGREVDEEYALNNNFNQKKPSVNPKTLVLVLVLLGILGFNISKNFLKNDDFTASSETNTVNTVVEEVQNVVSEMDNTIETFDKPDMPDTNGAMLQKSEVQLPSVSVSSGAQGDIQNVKVNLKVVDSGRQNPFVPASNLNNLGFVTSPKIDIAQPFTKLGEPDPTLDKLMQIVVSGILYDGSSNPSAVINVSGTDYFVQKGDKVDTFTIIAITKDKVVIKDKTNIFTASIGQNFTNSGIITGQIKTINTANHTVQRQYTTSEDVGINVMN